MDRDERIAEVSYDYEAQPKRELAACPLCDGAELVRLTQRDRYGYPASTDLCLACGIAFLNPVMEGDAYGHFYDGVYRPLVSAYHGRLIDAGSILGEQAAYAAEVAEMIALHGGGRPVTSILDIGGSTGVVAHAITEATGARATVIDPAPPEIERARALGLDTVTGLVEEWDAGGATFDLILLCQTVDHLLDPRAVLARVHELLAEGGLFFVDFVDFRAGRDKAGSLVGATKIDHPFSFVEEVADRALRAAGLSIIDKERAGDGLHIRYLCEGGRSDPDAIRDPEVARALASELRAT